MMWGRRSRPPSAPGFPGPGAPFLASFARSGDFGARDPALHPFAILFYADLRLCFCFTKSMQRLIARFLLLFALVGTFVPLALAVTRYATARLLYS